MTLKMVLFMLLSFWASSVMAREICPATDVDHEWSTQCFEQHGDVRKVKPAYIRNLKVNRFGATTVLIAETRELVAVGRDGTVRIPNIRYTGDFDLPNPDGIGRFYSATKDASGKTVYRCGFYNQENFRIIAEPKYAQCEAFSEGAGFACVDCTAYCLDSDCHERVFTDGQGVTINRNGAIERTTTLRSLDDVCDGPGSASIKKLSDNLSVLTCLRKKPGPFDQLR